MIDPQNGNSRNGKRSSSEIQNEQVWITVKVLNDNESNVNVVHYELLKLYHSLEPGESVRYWGV